MGAQELYWENCSGQCKSAYLSLSTGASWAFGATQEHIVFTLFRNQVEASSKIEHSGVRVALGPHLGVRYSWSDRFKSLAEFNYLFLHKFEDEWRDEWWVQHSHQYYLKNSNWAVLLAGEHRERDHQGRIHLKYFF